MRLSATQRECKRPGEATDAVFTQAPGSARDEGARPPGNRLEVPEPSSMLLRTRLVLIVLAAWLVLTAAGSASPREALDPTRIPGMPAQPPPAAFDCKPRH